MTAITVDSKGSLATVAINPFKMKPEFNQVWKFSSVADKTATINYAIASFASQTALFSGKLRCIAVPPNAANPALFLPNPTPTNPAQFLLMDTQSMTLIGLSSNNQLSRVKLNTFVVPFSAETLDNDFPPWDNFAVKHMIEHIDRFWKDNSQFVWKLYPDQWNRPNGTSLQPE